MLIKSADPLVVANWSGMSTVSQSSTLDKHGFQKSPHQTPGANTPQN